MPPEVEELVEKVACIRATLNGAINIYDEPVSVGVLGDVPGKATERKMLLRRYLAARWSAPTVLVGEAPGNWGARFTGVPFTSEWQLQGFGDYEETARHVHDTLAELDLEDEVLLWNASVLLPDWETGKWKPRREELLASSEVLGEILSGRTNVYAVGVVAKKATGALCIPHPSRGNQRLFKEAMTIVFRSTPGTDIGAALEEVWERHPARNRS